MPVFCANCFRVDDLAVGRCNVDFARPVGALLMKLACVGIAFIAVAMMVTQCHQEVASGFKHRVAVGGRITFCHSNGYDPQKSLRLEASWCSGWRWRVSFSNATGRWVVIALGDAYPSRSLVFWPGRCRIDGGDPQGAAVLLQLAREKDGAKARAPRRWSTRARSALAAGSDAQFCYLPPAQP